MTCFVCLHTHFDKRQQGMSTHSAHGTARRPVPRELPNYYSGNFGSCVLCGHPKNIISRYLFYYRDTILLF